MSWFSERALVVRNVLDRRWVKIALGVWPFVASYDLLISQILPERWADKAPKVRDLIGETSGWLPFWAWLLILAAILVAAMLEYSVRKTRPDRNPNVGKEIALSADLVESIPNLRVADSPAAIALFDGHERDKIVPLLEAGKLTAWARGMGTGEPPLLKLDGSIWRSHYLQFLPKMQGEVKTKNQTFLKTNARHENSYYDIFLNLEQSRKIWPHLEAGADNQWKAAPEAVEAFAASDLIATRDKWKQALYDASLYGHEAEDKIAALKKKMGSGMLGIEDTRELNVNRRKLELTALQSDMAKDELRRAWDALRFDVQTKLMSGNLVARGFRVPHVAGSSEVEILPSEWRILTLQNVTSEASSKTSSDALYTGIVVRKA